MFSNCVIICDVNLFIFSEEINFWIEGLLRYTKNSIERSKEAVDHFFKGKSLFNNWNNINNFREYMHSAQFDNLLVWNFKLGKLDIRRKEDTVVGPACIPLEKGRSNFGFLTSILGAKWEFEVHVQSQLAKIVYNLLWDS